MSEVAGRLAPQMGAWALEKATAAAGSCSAACPGVPPAKVVVLGGGVVGLNAAIIALGMQADVWVLDKSVDRMRDLEIALDGRVTLAMSNRLQIEEVARRRRHGDRRRARSRARSRRSSSRARCSALMKPGAVLVDVAIDQGGCFETSHATTHDDPVFEVDGIVHYCVANMPGAVPDHVDEGADERDAAVRRGDRRQGARAARSRDDPALAKGVNVARRARSPTRRSPRRTACRTRRSHDAMPRRVRLTLRRLARLRRRWPRSFAASRFGGRDLDHARR